MVRPASRPGRGTARTHLAVICASHEPPPEAGIRGRSSFRRRLAACGGRAGVVPATPLRRAGRRDRVEPDGAAAAEPSRSDERVRPPPRARRSADPPDPLPVELVTNDTRRGGQLRITLDRPGHPVDVRRLERGDLAQRVAPELPEVELDLERVGERGAHTRLMASGTPPLHGARGRRGSQLPGRPVRARRRLAGQRVPLAGRRGRLVSGPEGAARVQPTGHRPGRARPRRSSAARSLARRGPSRWCIGASGPRARPTRARTPSTGPDRAARTGERRVRRVDLRHPCRGATRRRRVVAGQVRVVAASEGAPGRLDVVGRGAGFDAEHDVGILRRHGRSVALGSCPPSADPVPAGWGSQPPPPRHPSRSRTASR